MDKGLEIIIDPVYQKQMILINYLDVYGTVTLAHLNREAPKWSTDTSP